jgi:hypothetical protein
MYDHYTYRKTPSKTNHHFSHVIFQSTAIISRTTKEKVKFCAQLYP